MVSVREGSRGLSPVKDGAEVAAGFQTPWLQVDKDTCQAMVTALPDETSTLFPVQVQLVVEFYSQML